MQGVQTAEIDTTTIRKIERVRVGKEHIERMNIVQFAIRSMNKAWYAAAQVSRECMCTTALVERKLAHGSTDNRKSIVVESSAQTAFVKSSCTSSSVYLVSVSQCGATNRLAQPM